MDKRDVCSMAYNLILSMRGAEPDDEDFVDLIIGCICDGDDETVVAYAMAMDDGREDEIVTFEITDEDFI